MLRDAEPRTLPARWLRGQGFPALATTSAGFVSQGRADQDVPLAMMLAHIADIVAAVPDVPVNADLENGYADSPEDVAANVEACVATGVAGLSIEDRAAARIRSIRSMSRWRASPRRAGPSTRPAPASC